MMKLIGSAKRLRGLEALTDAEQGFQLHLLRLIDWLDELMTLLHAGHIDSARSAVESMRARIVALYEQRSKMNRFVKASDHA